MHENRSGDLEGVQGTINLDCSCHINSSDELYIEFHVKPIRKWLIPLKRSRQRPNNSSVLVGTLLLF